MYNKNFLNNQKAILVEDLATDGGTSDARFIKNYCEVIELGIRNQTLHQIDEFIYLDDLDELTKIYYQILENYFKNN